MCMSYPHWPDFPNTHIGPMGFKPILGFQGPYKPTINIYLKGGACSQAKPKMHPMLMVNYSDSVLFLLLL